MLYFHVVLCLGLILTLCLPGKIKLGVFSPVAAPSRFDQAPHQEDQRAQTQSQFLKLVSDSLALSSKE